MSRLDRLTEREVDVCRELVKGLPDKEIGENLGMSLSTVKSYMSRIRWKFRIPPGRIPRLVMAVYLTVAAQDYPLIAAALDL